jgi:thiamine pyrophosphate-dependent acetolactate synthase large subunit-like protein
MNTRDALRLIAPHLGDEVCVYSNGYISRAACAERDTEGSFYMIGSMGLAAPIGLGIALARPGRRVVVFEGDGNVLMNPGALARIAAAAPPNLLHVCLDNRAHASTGGQATISPTIRLEALAAAAGYRSTKRVRDAATLAATIPSFLASEGPAFLLVEVELGPKGPPGPRIPYSPEETTARLRRALLDGRRP